MEKRVLLAVILSFVVLYGFQAMFAPPPQTEGESHVFPISKTLYSGRTAR